MYGRMGNGLGIVAPWGLRSMAYGNLGDLGGPCETYDEARILAQRYGLQLPKAPASCSPSTPTILTTPSAAPIPGTSTAPTVPAPTAPASTELPYVPPPDTGNATPWYMWAAGVAVLGALVWSFK